MRVGHAVLIAWAGLTLWQLGFVGRYGRDYPACEEWLDVPAVLGGSQLPWVFERLQEHRYIFGRVVYLAAFEAAGQDYRAGMVLGSLLLSATALAVVRLAARVRGRPHPIDVTIPCLMLGPNHHENLLLGFQVYFTLNVLLAAGWLWLAASDHPRAGVAAAGLLVLFALGGGVGLAFVPPGACWIGYLACRAFRSGLLGTAAGMVAVTAGVVAYLAWAAADVARVPVPGRVASDPATLARVAVEFLGTGFGLRAVTAGPAGAIAVLLWVATATALAVVAARRPERRAVALGWLAVVLAVGVMAVGVGRYRTSAFASRYTSLACLVPVTAVLAGAAFGPRLGRTGTALGWATAIVAAGLCWAGSPMAGYMGGFFRTGFERMAADTTAGVPVEFAANHTQMFPNEAFPAVVRGLRVRGRPPVGAAPDAPPTAAVPVEIVPTTDPWPPGPDDAMSVGRPPVWRIDLPEARHVVGVRVRFRFRQADYLVPLQLAWADGGPPKHATNFLWLGDGTWEALFWVDGPASRFWFRPAKEPHRVEVVGAELLVISDTMTGLAPLSR
jgi:hypothetical protein